MRILVIGATGTIRQAVAEALEPHHEILPVSRRKTRITVDLAQPASIRAMYRAAGAIDAVVSAAGLAKFAPMAELGDDDYAFSLANKLMGQVNRYALDSIISAIAARSSRRAASWRTRRCPEVPPSAA